MSYSPITFLAFSGVAAFASDPRAKSTKKIFNIKIPPNDRKIIIWGLSKRQ
jgi:hypothetical protein